jgi:hypothetical protein
VDFVLKRGFGALALTAENWVSSASSPSAYDAVPLAVVLDVHRPQEAGGFGPVTLVSADRDLNAAAAAEGLAVNDPTTHP